jgi:hypothetical protein
MIQAQLFVMAPSAFSSLPAYYNKGIVVYEKDQFQSARRLGHWLTAQDLFVLLKQIAACQKK